MTSTWKLRFLPSLTKKGRSGVAFCCLLSSDEIHVHPFFFIAMTPSSIFAILEAHSRSLHNRRHDLSSRPNHERACAVMIFKSKSTTYPPLIQRGEGDPVPYMPPKNAVYAPSKRPNFQKPPPAVMSSGTDRKRGYNEAVDRHQNREGERKKSPNRKAKR